MSAKCRIGQPPLLVTADVFYGLSYLALILNLLRKAMFLILGIEQSSRAGRFLHDEFLCIFRPK